MRTLGNLGRFIQPLGTSPPSGDPPQSCSVRSALICRRRHVAQAAALALGLGLAVLAAAGPPAEAPLPQDHAQPSTRATSLVQPRPAAEPSTYLQPRPAASPVRPVLHSQPVFSAPEATDVPSPPPPAAPPPATAPGTVVPQAGPTGMEVIPPGRSTGLPPSAMRLELVEFREQPLGDALRLFSAQTGFNIIASPEARKLTVSLFLRNVSPDAALDALCKANDLWYKTDAESGIVRIYTNREYHRDLTSFREEQTEVFTLLYPNPVDVATAIRSVYGDRVLLNLESQWQDVYQDLEERFDRFDLVDERSQGLGFFQGNSGAGIAGGFGGGIGGIGGVGGGGFSGSGGSGGRGSRGGFSSGNTGRVRRQDLVSDGRTARQEVVQTREIPRREEFRNLTSEEIQTLEAAATGQGQVNQAILDELVARRRATIYVTVIRPHNQLLVRTSDEKTMQQIRELVRRIDVPTPLVLLEVKILEVSLTDDFTSVFDYQFSDGMTVAGGFTSGNILPPIADNPARIVPPRTRRDSILTPEDLVDPTTGQPNRPLTFQFVNDNFRARLQLLENNNRLTTLSSPLLLTANNEVSRLFVGEEVPLNRSFTGPTPLVTATTTAFTSGSTGIEFRPVGTTLLITPNINADRTVTLRILQEVSQVNEAGQPVLVPTNTGFEQQIVPTVQSRTVSGTVVGMDGCTVAIGGLIQEQVFDTRAEVPILGKLPVVGFFFRQQESRRTRTELVILIRPYVFSTPCETAAKSKELVQDLSLHPMRCNPHGTMNTFLPHEVIRANPPVTECQKVFRFHSLEPKRY